MADTPLLTMQDVTISLKDKVLVNRLSLSINLGETVALVGDSGAGKSLTAYSIPGLLPEDMVVTGQIHYEDQSLLSLPPEQMKRIRGKQIGMIFQEPMTSLNPLHKVGRQVEENLLIHQSMTKKEALKKTIALFRDVELPQPEELVNRLPHQLSGGQRQRVMIAMAIANKPRLLIADEPTTALDVTVEQQVLQLIQRLQRKYQMAVLFITHDLGIVKRYCDKVCVMADGAIIEQAPTNLIFSAPKHQVTRELINSRPSGSPYPPAQNQTMTLHLSSLFAWYRSQKTWFKAHQRQMIVKDITLSIKAGETLGVVGESGSGKTSLGLAILKMLNSEGEIYVKERAVHTLNEKAFRPIRKDIQLVFQDPFGSLNPRMTISDILEEGLMIHTILNADERLTRMQQTLGEVGFESNVLNRYPHEFSGGQRQRIALARAIVLRPALVILDEPTSSLDRRLQLQLIDLLRELQRKYGLSYIFISHDLSVVRAMSHRIAVLKDGEIVERGDTETILNSPQHSYTQALFNAALSE
ncbi:ABC transporter ATP-binding protein [Sansalvadorimonas verongulae]|uniref:ABC transporter ATP-binding protein n=1 Tax=Sansalvadorimonas verongulae TaxID=2172824 RepID=UPI0012BC9BFD|nr:dipeptide ABC transporter ATP-binding protein [Sansalvadorimonas verongulae]MTI14657.1 ABC transporter ATP-binding protein [Sansalvadorimonas verongulae]